MASLGATAAIGIATGPVLAGFTATVQGAFWMLAGLAAVSMVLVGVREVGRDIPRARVDYLGAALMTLLILFVLVPVSMGNEWGWTSPKVLGCVAGAAVAGVVWAPFEWRHAAPFFDLRVNARGVTLLSHMAAGAAGFMMFGNALVASSILQAPLETRYGWGLSVTESGGVFVLGAVAMAASAPASSWLIRRVGARSTMIVACLIVGGFYLARLPLNAWLAGLLVSFIGIFAGVSIAISALAVIAFEEAPRGRVAEVLGTQQVIRLTGQAASSSLIGLVSGWLVIDIHGVSHPAWSAIVVCSIAGALGAFACSILVLTIFRLARKAEAGEVRNLFMSN